MYLVLTEDTVRILRCIILGSPHGKSDEEGKNSSKKQGVGCRYSYTGLN